MTNVVLVLTTVPDDGRAEEMARMLVHERLAACVSVHGPMTSIYWWKGAVSSDVERQIIIKTTRERLPALQARLEALHSYDLPEFVVVPVDAGSAGYLEWVNQEVKQP